MQSRQIRKVQHGRQAEHAADKWQDERKVHLGFIFESWKSLRDKRADTDPGLAFHLMEIHDQYCFCRFEEAQSTVRGGDSVVSTDAPEPPDEKDEITERYPNISSPESTEYLKQSSRLPLSEQQHQSKAETFSRPHDNFEESLSPVNNEAYVTERLSPSLGDSLFPGNVGSSQTLSSFGYSVIKTVSMENAQIPGQPVNSFHMTNNICKQSEDDGAPTNSPHDPSNLHVKVEPIDIDSDPDELDEHSIIDISKIDHSSTAMSNTEENQRDHLQSQLPITDRMDHPWMCHQCPKSYHSKKSLIRHVKSHDGANFECHMCCKKFFSRWEMQQHVEAHTDCFLCAVCGKSFNWTKSLRRHYKQSHSVNKDFRCKHCNACFKDRNGLLEHKSNECMKSFLCARCGSEFRFKKSLDFHEMNVCLKRLVTREGYTFKCESCGKAFKTGRLLQQHELLHKPPAFKCHGCGNVFTYRTSLRFHMRSCQACMLISLV